MTDKLDLVDITDLHIEHDPVPTECAHCQGPIEDEYPINLYVKTAGDSSWAVHVDCYWELQVKIIASEWMDESKWPEEADDEQLLENLKVEAQRLERTVKAYQELQTMILKCEARL